MTTENQNSPILKDINSENLKKCPFCANEINIDAIKCQYCGEFLNNDERKNGNNNKNKQGKRYQNIWFWIILGIILIVFGFGSNVGKQIKTSIIVNKAIKNTERVKSFDEIKEGLNNITTSTPEEESRVNEVGEIMDAYITKVQSVDSSLLYLEPKDYKNKNKLKESINARKLYATYLQEYINNIEDSIKKYKDLDDTGTGKYSLNGLLKAMKSLSKAVSSYKYQVTNFYNYILTIQDDFSIGADGKVYFYSGGTKMNKYNQLLTELNDIAVSFYAEYNNYMEYMDGYNRYWNL